MRIIRAIKERVRGKDYTLVLLFILVLIISLVGNTNKYPDTYWGKPVVSIDYPDLHKRNIEQVLVDDDYMYILPYHSDGIIQVCDKDGEYKFTLFFYENLNGHFSMVIEDGLLYVRDMRGNVYVFNNGEFDYFLKNAEAKQQLSHIDLLSDASSPNYEIRSNSIWRSTEYGEECIVVTQKTDYVGTTIVIAVFGLIIIAKMVKETKKEINVYDS